MLERDIMKVKYVISWGGGFHAEAIYDKAFYAEAFLIPPVRQKCFVDTVFLTINSVKGATSANV